MYAVSLVFLAVFAHAAAIHGTVYAWDTLEPLSGVIVEISTQPRQTFVSETGAYEFEVPEGSYALSAVASEAGVVKYYGEEPVLVGQEGNFVIDVVAFSPLGEDTELIELLSDDAAADTNADDAWAGLPAPDSSLVLIAVALLAAGAFAVYLLLGGAGKGSAQSLPSESMRKQAGVVREQAGGERGRVGLQAIGQETSALPALDKSAMEVLRIIQRADGRITQMDLRKKVDFGEAQTSLILTDLESRGYVRKIKKGRGNIIILKRAVEEGADES